MTVLYLLSPHTTLSCVPMLFQMQISFSDMVIPIEILGVLCSFEIITSTDASNSLEKLLHDNTVNMYKTEEKMQTMTLLTLQIVHVFNFCVLSPNV